MNTAYSHPYQKTSQIAAVPVKQTDHSAADVQTGKNSRRLSLILESNAQQVDVFDLIGWSYLPDSLKTAVRSDMESYRDELLGLYSTCDQQVRNRRKSVSYWIRAYRDGICSEQTAVQALSQAL